jgi:cobyrinic acid a,c-diamide synthase
MNHMKAIVIAAPASGSGKTTVTLGIMACLKKRGLTVAPFKAGPDFIDPGWHRLVTGRPSVNLDGWICPEGFVRQTFALHAQGADIAVIEGVMGLFDGIGGESESGSTAQIAKIVDAPVILVVDAKSQARSAAALVQGFARFDRQVRVAGVIFNNVGSDNHARILRQAVESSVPEVTVLGCIPRDERLHIPSRHLGLVTAGEDPLQETFLENLSDIVEKHVDLDKLLSIRGQVYAFHNPDVKCVDLTPDKVRIAVARDRAFCFVYEDNLRLLREAGAETVDFSPLSDSSLPADIGGIYLPGGYPELFADALSGNKAMKKEIREAVETGMPVYAECGGFIYLTRGQALTPMNEFVGVFPVLTRMLPRRKALGYREVELLADSPIGHMGMIARGHEFHYSEMEDMPEEVERVYRVRKNGEDLGTEGYRYKNCHASYIHLHFGSCPEVAAAFIENCREFREKLNE